MSSEGNKSSGVKNLAIDLSGLKSKKPKTMKNNLMFAGANTDRNQEDEQYQLDRARCKKINNAVCLYKLF